jgi:hypothetical protein
VSANQQQPDETTLAALTLLLLAGLNEDSILPRVTALLEPLGITAAATTAALSLLHPHAPAADLTQHPTTAQGFVALTEVPYSAAYLVNAALRLSERLDVEAERRYLSQHLQAQSVRREAAQRVDAAARMFGPTLGWRSILDGRTTPACKSAHGSNFNFARPPRIGYPGSLHGGGCRCLPGPPWPDASTVDEALAGVVVER